METFLSYDIRPRTVDKANQETYREHFHVISWLVLILAIFDMPCIGKHLFNLFSYFCMASYYCSFSLCICVYVNVYVCVYVNVYVCVYVYVCSCVCVFHCVCICVHVCLLLFLGHWLYSMSAYSYSVTSPQLIISIKSSLPNKVILLGP